MSTRSGSRSSLFLLLLVALLLVGAPAAAQSLWNARAGNLVTDLRAARAGDLVTILVDEQSSADKSGETKLNRASSFASQVSRPSWLRRLLDSLLMAGTANSDYDGKSSTNRSDHATAQITARVMRVLDNGNMLIEGRRLVVANDEAQTIVISGVIRPQDISADNIVRSSSIADAEVRLEGNGTVSDRQRPGFLQRAFDFLGLF